MKKLLILAVFCLLAFSTDAVAQFVNTNTTKQKAYTKESQISTAATTNKAYIKEPETNTASNKSKVDFSGTFNTGVIFDADGAGPICEASIGATFLDFLYLGGYLGIHGHFVPVPKELQDYYDEKVLTNSYFPIGAHMKILMLERSKYNVVPYIEGTFGGFIGVNGMMEGLNGFFCQAGMGLEFGGFTLGIGYNGLVKGGTANFGYIKIGFIW